MTKGHVAAVAAAVALGAPVTAFAQQAQQTTTPQAQQAEQSQRAPQRAGGLPAADQPMIRKIPQPALSVEGGAGVIGFVGGVGDVGPGWNVRVTGTLTDRFAIEGNYLGSVNKRVDTGDTLVMTAFDAGLRYNLLLPEQFPVQPFVVGGVGYAGFTGSNGDPAMLTVPLVAGAERLLTPNIKIGARFSYRPAFFDNLSSPRTPAGEKPGADTWMLLGQLGGGF